MDTEGKTRTASMEQNDRERIASALPSMERIAALLPVMETRYWNLVGELRRAAEGEEVEYWEIDLCRADLAAVLEVMNPQPDEDDELRLDCIQSAIQ